MYVTYPSIRAVLLLAVSSFIIVFTAKLIVPLFRERSRGKRILKNVNGMKPHWLFGSMLEVQPTQESFHYVVSLSKLYPKINPLWFGPFVWYLAVGHPQTVQPVLATAEPKDYLGYGFLRPWIGDGLLVSSGKKWHRNRHLLTRAFHFEIVKGYTTKFNVCANTMLNKFSAITHDAPAEIFGRVSLMTLDNILQCTMSCETNCQEERNENEYIKAVCSMGTIILNRMFNSLIHNDFIFNLTPSGRRFRACCDYVHEFDEKVIQERKTLIDVMMKNQQKDRSSDTICNHEDEDFEFYKNRKGKNLDFLDILLLTKDKDGKGLSDREIRDEVDTFLFEGHDTTASGISWAFYCLACYPEYQEKCREEVQRVVGDKENIEWDDLSNLSYVTMFIKEVLRLYPPVYSIARKTTKPLLLPRGFGKDQYCMDDVVPADCSRVMDAPTSFDITIFVLHRNPTVWENPEVFDPTRFTMENCKHRSPHAYLPFSAGPRNCIGKRFAMAEIQVTMCKALQRFRFYVDDDCPKPKLQPSLTLKAVDGIFIKIDNL